MPPDAERVAAGPEELRAPTRELQDPQEPLVLVTVEMLLLPSRAKTLTFPDPNEITAGLEVRVPPRVCQLCQQP